MGSPEHNPGSSRRGLSSVPEPVRAENADDLLRVYLVGTLIALALYLIGSWLQYLNR